MVSVEQEGELGQTRAGGGRPWKADGRQNGSLLIDINKGLEGHLRVLAA